MDAKTLWLIVLTLSMAACSATSAPESPATTAPSSDAPRAESSPDSPKIRVAPEAASTTPARPAQQPISERPSPARATDGAFAVSMSRSACFGRCPQYQVTLHADGTVEFVGVRNVHATGPHRKMVEPASVARLLVPARALFAQHQDYTPDNKACRPYATDMPTISLGFDENGTPHTLRHYLGCPNPPAPLTDFEKLVSEVADVGEWTTQHAER